MELSALIKNLEGMNQDAVIKYGFHEPHSYRGYYYDLAFEPKENVKVSEMLESAKSALGETYEGWKGGEYTMVAETECYIANMGCIGEGIGLTLIHYWDDEAKAQL